MEGLSSSKRQIETAPPIKSSPSGCSEQMISQVDRESSVKAPDGEPLQPRVGYLETPCRVGSPAPGQQGRSSSRPTSATGRVPSVLMLTSVDHSDASK